MITEDHITGKNPAEDIGEAFTDLQEAADTEDFLSMIELMQIITHGTFIKTVKSNSKPNGNGHVAPLNPGNRFVNRVPPPLRHVGCMWMENGDETKRCGKQVAWTMGANLSLARFYCEDHAKIILQRRRFNYEKAAQLKRRNGKTEQMSDQESPPQCRAAGDEDPVVERRSA